MFVLLSSLRYLLTKQKARSPAVKRVPHAFVQKQNLFCSFYAFVSGIRTGSAAFALRTPLSLLHVWIFLIIAYCQNFASTFCQPQGEFCRRSPYFIKLLLRFFILHPRFRFLFFVKLSFGLNNFKITAFPPAPLGHAGQRTAQSGSLIPLFLPALRCHSLVYRIVSLPISYAIQNPALFLALSHHGFISNVRLILCRIFPSFPNIIYFVNNHCIGCKH